jgi:hypothetical protein
MPRSLKRISYLTLHIRLNSWTDISKTA